MSMSGSSPVPNSGSPGLARARLLRRVSEADIAVVIAPAGSGKTHLLQQHATDYGDGVAWYRADPDDIDATRFMRRLEGVAAAAPRTLIVDDFHFVVGGPAESAFERFALPGPTGGPDRPRIVLGTRVRPTMNLMRAEIGRVALLSGDDLRFRCWEVEELFAVVYGRPLSPDDAAALSRHTDGWAAGLHLFHLGTQSLGAGGRRAAIHALSGRSRYLQGYLAKTVLGELPPELCEFLRRTYVFETVTASRCDRLLGRTDSAVLLAELERRQALTSSDDDGHSYRYHEVLRQHLASALRTELGAVAAARWCERAAAQLEAEQAHAEAARLYARAERWGEVTRLLRSHGARVVGDPQSSVWCEGLPTTVVDQDPWLSVATARRAVAAGDPRRGSQHYRHAEQLFTEPDHRDSVARERRLVDIWLDAPPRPELHWLDRLRAMTMRRPLDYVEVDIGGAGDYFVRTCALLLAGRIRDANHPTRWPVGAPPSPLLDLWEQFAGVLAALVCGEDVGTRIEHLACDAEQAGVGILVRQCRALTMLGTVCGPTEVVGESDAIGDRWGATFAAGVAALQALLAGERSAPLWRSVVERCVALRADTLEAWALAFAALAALADADAGADSLPAPAEAFARKVGVPGARVIALLAGAGRSDSAAAGRLAAARALAAEIGMPLPQPLVDRVCGAEPSATTVVMEIPSGDAELRVRCLGAFSVAVDGAALDWRTLRPRAGMTLRYLSMRAGRWVHRDDLVAALWPDLSTAQARQNLQVTVSSVRRFLQPGIERGKSTLLVRQGETYSIVLAGDSVADVVTFGAAVEAARVALQAGDEDGVYRAVTDALAEYRGDLLPSDGPAEWVVAERDRLRIQAALAATTLAELELRRGNAVSAIEALQRGLTLDPYLDRAWRLLISAYQRVGDLAAAEHTRRDYAGMLRDLGVQPEQPVTVAPGPVRTERGPGTSPRPRARSATG
ncbi:BTAD domain-containing putative transcriptional regulator [Nocardia sp. NPDC050710]|uniref:BTAD domain-containing putative transcriptional regulator n=1 Tax=Nocardia sp. NPDC050710 TaxID=3157220 RepID=UPI0033E332EA